MKPKAKQIFIRGVLVLLCLSGTWFGLQRPALPFRFVESPAGQLVFDQSRVSSSFAAPGDILIACNRHQVRSLKSLELIIDGKKIGDVVKLTTLHQQQKIIEKIKLVPYYSLRYLLITIPFGLLFLGLGIFVNMKRPEKPEAQIFYYNMASIAIMYFFPWRPYSFALPGLAIFLQAIYLTAYAATPLLFLKFSQIYPREKIVPHKKFAWLLTSLFFALVCWLTIGYAIATIYTDFDWYSRFTFWFNVFRILFSGSLLLGLAQFIHSYFTALEEEDRRKLRWILLGLAIGASTIVFLWTIPQIFLKRGLLPEEFVLLICAVVPISFAISIVRHHLLDIDIIFNRSVVYATIFIIIAAIYATAIGVFAYLVSTFTVETSVAVSAILAALIVIIFEPLRQKIQKLVDRTFFRMRYNYREALQNYTDELHTCLSVQKSGAVLLNHIELNILPEFAGFYERFVDNDQFKLLAESALPGHLKNPQFLLKRLPLSGKTKYYANFKYLESQTNFNELDTTAAGDAEPVLNFFLQDESHLSQVCLILGPKKSGFRYSLEDIALLRACANQASETIARLRLQQKLIYEQELAQSLAELSKTKSQFISSVTHEFKTPLTAIKMFADLLQNPETLREKIIEYSTIIEGEADRLNRLIGTILDFAKLERGNKNYQFESLDFNKVIEHALQPFAYVFKIEAFEVIIDLNPQPLPVFADADALIQIINNLVNNAMKYSMDSHKIIIASSQQNGYAVLKVKDYGIGIAPADHEKIFDPFFRAADEQVQRIGGAGLGLQVVNSIVEAHNGYISVESELEKGSTFSVYLPMEKADETHTDH